MYLCHHTSIKLKKCRHFQLEKTEQTDHLRSTAQMDKLNPTNSTAMPIRHYTLVNKSSPISTLNHTSSIWPQAGIHGTAPAPLCRAHSRVQIQRQTAYTDVPPQLAQLPAATNNFSATELKFWGESVIGSRQKANKSIGLYSIVTSCLFWQIQASTPFLRGMSKVPEGWALSALFSAPDFKHSCTFVGVWRSRSPFWYQS